MATPKNTAKNQHTYHANIAVDSDLGDLLRKVLADNARIQIPADWKNIPDVLYDAIATGLEVLAMRQADELGSRYYDEANED